MPTSFSSADGRALCTIVADPDSAMLRFYQQYLPDFGHQVCAAVGAKQLAEQCRALRPDLVITEVDLPDGDVLEVIAPVAAELPVVVVAARADAELAARAATGCVFAFLSKPVSAAGLGCAARVAVARFDQLRAARQARDDRRVIERAKDRVMRYLGLPEEEAYHRMQRMAGDRNQKLIDVARFIVDAAQAFDGLAGPAR